MDVSHEERIGVAKPHTILTKISQGDEDEALRTFIKNQVDASSTSIRLSTPSNKNKPITDEKL